MREDHTPEREKIIQLNEKVIRPVSRYLPHLYGEKEAGGTQYMLLAGVPFDLLGFNPRITDESYSVLTWQYIAKMPALIAILLAAGTASYHFTHRR